MANVIRYESDGPAAPKTAYSIEVNQAFMGRVDDPKGPLELLLRTYDGLVSLQNADRTWGSLVSNTRRIFDYRPVDLEIVVTDPK